MGTHPERAAIEGSCPLHPPTSCLPAHLPVANTCISSHLLVAQGVLESWWRSWLRSSTPSRSSQQDWAALSTAQSPTAHTPCVGCLPSLSHSPTPPAMFARTTSQITQLLVSGSASGSSKLDRHLHGECNLCWLTNEEGESVRQHRARKFQRAGESGPTYMGVNLCQVPYEEMVIWKL